MRVTREQFDHFLRRCGKVVYKTTWEKDNKWGHVHTELGPYVSWYWFPTVSDCTYFVYYPIWYKYNYRLKDIL